VPHWQSLFWLRYFLETYYNSSSLYHFQVWSVTTIPLSFRSTLHRESYIPYKLHSVPHWQSLFWLLETLGINVILKTKKYKSKFTPSCTVELYVLSRCQCNIETGSTICRLVSWSIVVLTLVFHNPLLVLRYLIENNLNQTYTYNSTVHEGDCMLAFRLKMSQECIFRRETL
jgi:hypothetical protein